MDLGEAATKTAPCHRIDPRNPGTGYAITEDGAATKVRAHFADDQLIHAVEREYPTPHRLPAVSLAPAPDPFATVRPAPPTPASPAAESHDRPAPGSTPRQRKPRKPRTPRASTRQTVGGDAA
jgi:S-DNA-T family DNA segregation ATPase FtsK/SpoIIIE